MDDLRAGLVAAGRAVSEAQQEAEAVKKAVGQQEAALAGKHGTSVDVLKRLGEVTGKLEGKDALVESLKAELATAKKSAEDTGVQLAVVQKAARAKEAEAATAMAAAKKTAISREVELNAALAAAKSAAQKAMASAAAARAERTSDIIDVLSAKETQVEGLMMSLDAIKVEREMMASEGVPEEDKEEVAEKDELIRALLADLAKENGWRPAISDVVGYTPTELRELRASLEKAEKAAGIVRVTAAGSKAHSSDVDGYNLEEIATLRSVLDARESELGKVVSAASRSPSAVSTFSKGEVEALRAALASREKQLGMEPVAGSVVSSVGGLTEKDLDRLRGELSSSFAKQTVAALEAELAQARGSAKERAKLIAELQKELDTMIKAGDNVSERDSTALKIVQRREEVLNAELGSLRGMYDAAKAQHAQTLATRDAVVDSVKVEALAVRKKLSEAEKDAASLRRDAAAREVEAQAEASSAKAAAQAAKVAHAAQVSAKEAAIEALRADLAAARRAITSAEADIVSIKKSSAAREAQLTAELNASKRSYEVLKLAAAAGKPGSQPEAEKKGPDGKPLADGGAGLFRPGEVTAQLAAREAQVESLRAELLAVRRAVTAAEEEAQSRREAAAALESELSSELSAAKAAHEAAEMAAAELATNAASNAQNAAKMMSLLSEQLSAEREARRVLEAELRAAMEAHPDMPRITFPLPPLAPPGKQGGGGLGLLKGIVAGVAAGFAVRAMPQGPQPQPSPGAKKGGVTASPVKAPSPAKASLSRA